MSAENVEVIRRGWEAYERGDLAGALEAFTPDVVTVRDAALLDPGTYHGREGVLQSLFDWTESFDEFEQTVLGHTDAGDRVITRVRQEGKGTASGAPVAIDVWMVSTFREGKISRFEFFADEEKAREAAGLPATGSDQM